MITLRQLDYARTLAQLRSFRLAAKALHLSQPALTRSIKALENALGVPLFDRLPAGVEPTRFGEVLLGKARLILRERDDLVREMRLLMGLEKGSIRMSAGASPSDLLVPGVAARLVSRHPGLSCCLRLANWREVVAQVVARDADLGIADLAAANDEHLSTEPLGQHRFYFYCRKGHPLLRRPRVTLAEMVAVPWVGTRTPLRVAAGLSLLVEARAGAIDPVTGDFVPAWEVEAVNSARRIVAASDAIGAALLTQIEREIEDETLDIVPYHAPWMYLNYGFIYLRDCTVLPAIRLAMEEFRRLDAELATREGELRRRYKVGVRTGRGEAKRA